MKSVDDGPHERYVRAIRARISADQAGSEQEQRVARENEERAREVCRAAISAPPPRRSARARQPRVLFTPT